MAYMIDVTLYGRALLSRPPGCSNYNRTHQSVPFRALPAIRGPNGLGALDLDAYEDLAVAELGKPSEA